MERDFDFVERRWIQNMKCEEVEEYLKNGGDSIIIPCGQTEQHGPHLPMGTDAYVAIAIAASLSEKVDALIAPPVWTGWAPRMQAFAGSLTLRAETVEKILIDYFDSFARHGFKRMYVVNGHRRENLPPLKIACARGRYRTGAWIAVLDPSFFGVKTQYALRNGNANLLSHAAGFETANMLYIAPDLVRKEQFCDTPEEMQANADQYVIQDKALIYDTPEEFREQRGAKGVKGTVKWGNGERGRIYHEAVVNGMAEFIMKNKEREVVLKLDSRYDRPIV